MLSPSGNYLDTAICPRFCRELQKAKGAGGCPCSTSWISTDRRPQAVANLRTRHSRGSLSRSPGDGYPRTWLVRDGRMVRDRRASRFRAVPGGHTPDGRVRELMASCCERSVEGASNGCAADSASAPARLHIRSMSAARRFNPNVESAVGRVDAMTVRALVCLPLPVLSGAPSIEARDSRGERDSDSENEKNSHGGFEEKGCKRVLELRWSGRGARMCRLGVTGQTPLKSVGAFRSLTGRDVGDDPTSAGRDCRSTA